MLILFFDICFFIIFLEIMILVENFKFINFYFFCMEFLIIINYGFIDKYIGDVIMVLFGWCFDDVVKVVLGMFLELNKYNIIWKNNNKLFIKIGIGINIGFLMLGIVGGINRMDIIVISDFVNLVFCL